MTDARRVPTDADRARWRRYLADERAEAAVYRELAARRGGEEREILLALAAAEGRHEAHWLGLLDGDERGIPRADIRTRTLAALAKRFGSIFVLALAQQAEGRSPYASDPDATAAMAADERIHGEVVRGLAARGRRRLAGTFRAAVFGANDGLVSNLALVLGIGATGVPAPVVLFTGVAGLLAGALSMGAGEFVSVRSQRELLAASAPDPTVREALADVDLDANELALVYRARGMSEAEAADHAALVIARVRAAGAGETSTGALGISAEDDEAVGTAWSAASSSFLFFASGALIPVLPYLLGMSGAAAVAVATVLVGIALLLTGATVGVLSGGSPLQRALRQLAIGLGAAAVTYLLGLAFGTTLG
ncbi:VIT1/CCC1 family protein [Agromyces sp. MMS24-JH15]|uniref:VIT1/CCC1 transporter family protein n=1 Tax=Agromyces sp. MMS24-JH15 TaxID=3243765 RepID=UPI0037494510